MINKSTTYDLFNKIYREKMSALQTIHRFFSERTFDEIADEHEKAERLMDHFHALNQLLKGIGAERAIRTFEEAWRIEKLKEE